MRIIFDRFPEGKTKALTMSYDDGRDHDLRLIEIFNKYGIKGTFHLNSASIEGGSTNHVSVEDVREKYKGHEVSLHTHTHPHLERAPREVIIHEVMENRRLLESYCGYPACAYRICGAGDGLWGDSAVPGIWDSLGAGYEYLHLRRIHAVSGSESAVRWCLAGDCCRNHNDGQCPAPVLRHFHD